MIYVDTSASVSVFIREPKSEAVSLNVQGVLCLDEAMIADAGRALSIRLSSARGELSAQGMRSNSNRRQSRRGRRAFR